MKIIYKIFLLLFLSSNLFGGEKIAYIQSIKGDVRIYSKNKLKPPIVAIIGREIQENDIIRTYGNSECVIIFKDKTTYLHLGSTSEIQFIESSLTRTMNVNYGNVFFYQVKNPKKHLYIFTLASQINLKEGKIWLSSNLSGDDEVYIIENSAQVYNEISSKGERTNKGKVAFSTLDGFFEIVKLKQDDLPKYVKKYINKDLKLGEFENLEFERLKKVKLKEWDLIPEYAINAEQDIEPLDEGFKYKLGIGLGKIWQSDFVEFSFVPTFHKGNIRMGFDFPIYLSSNNDIKINHWGMFDIIDKIVYLDYFSSNGKFFIHAGNISKITFGYGQLIRNYRNTYGYPHLQKTGITSSYEVKEDFLDLEMFVSDLADLSSSGMFFGIKSNIFLSKNFPLDIELGLVADVNQYSGLEDWSSMSNNIASRLLTGFNIHLNYELLSSYSNEVNVFFDMVSMFYPEKRVFQREYREVKRDGSWGISFPGIKYKLRKQFSLSAALHYNSSLFEPSFFNSTYDLTRVENLLFDNNSESEKQMIEDLLDYYDLYNGDIENSDYTYIYIPKDLITVINGSQNKYPTLGFSFDLERAISTIGGVEIFLQHLEEQIPADVKSVQEVIGNKYQTLDFRFFINDGVIVKMNEASLYFTQYNQLGGIDFKNYNINTSMGFRLDFEITEKMNLIFDMKDIFYDINDDGYEVNLFNQSQSEKLRSLNCDLLIAF